MIGALMVGLLTAAPASRYETALNKAKAAYLETDFDGALRELTIAGELASTDAQKLKVLLDRAAVLANVPDASAAEASWRRALALDPNSQIGLPVNRNIRAEFERIRLRVQEAARAEEIVRRAAATPPTPEASPTPVVSASPPPEVSVPSPRGRGRAAAVAVLGALGLANLGTAVGLTVWSNSVIAQARSSPWYDEKLALHQEATRQSLAANILFGVAGAFVLAALIALLVID